MNRTKETFSNGLLEQILNYVVIWLTLYHVWNYRISPNIRRGFLPRNIIKKQDSSYNRGLKNFMLN